MKCSHCNGTGDLHGMGYYDCTNCSVADERTALDAAIAALPPMVKEDVHWAAYQAGERMAEQRWQVERAELICQLRKMWGWAIELDHNGGFFCASEDDAVTLAQWRIDTREVLTLLQKEPKCKS